MKPLNFDNSPCSPTSSNCVIWAGPDLACINVCKGDNITDVTAKLATEICAILDTLNINSYDLDCFNLANCAPQTFQDLINFLIVKICQLENIPVTPVVPDSGDCPSNCIVDVAPCLIENGITTMSLTDYAIAIGDRLCSLIDTVSLQQIAITDLDVRVTALENTTPPSYTTPTMDMGCDIATLSIGSTQGIDTVIRTFINDIWCTYVSTTGNAGCLAAAVASQTVDGGDSSKTNPLVTMSVQYAGLWIEPASTICESINNIWLCIEDLRNAPVQSPFNLLGTAIDAGSNKTSAIERYNSIYTVGYDSYFNSVRIGLGNSNVSSNTAIGSFALLSNTTGSFNTAVGRSALTANTTGIYNVAVGTRALTANSVGQANVAIGDYCLNANLSGDYNISIGHNAMSLNTVGNNNVGIGEQALYKQTIGNSNTAIGSYAMNDNLTGSNNTAIGNQALYSNTTGGNNIAIGDIAGRIDLLGAQNINSNTSIYIGNNTRSSTTSDTNQIVIGYAAEGKGSNTIQIGNTSITRTYLQGDITISNATTVTAAVVSQTKHFPIVINGVTYKLLLAD